MKLIFYKTEDAENVIGKTLTDSYSVNIQLKASTDVSDPMILLRRIPGVELTDYNYCEIDALDRFYFIEQIEQRTNELIELRLHVDVLETYASDILESEGVYRRTIEPGDIQTVSLPDGYDYQFHYYDSDTELEPDQNLILTTYGGTQ